jgi:hypothetical protein
MRIFSGGSVSVVNGERVLRLLGIFSEYPPENENILRAFTEVKGILDTERSYKI